MIKYAIFIQCGASSKNTGSCNSHNAIKRVFSLDHPCPVNTHVFQTPYKCITQPLCKRKVWCQSPDNPNDIIKGYFLRRGFQRLIRTPCNYKNICSVQLYASKTLLSYPNQYKTHPICLPRYHGRHIDVIYLRSWATVLLSWASGGPQPARVQALMWKR